MYDSFSATLALSSKMIKKRCYSFTYCYSQPMWVYTHNALQSGHILYLVYWSQPVPPVVIVWSDETLVVLDVMIEYISVIVFPYLWDTQSVDPSTMFWSCGMIDTFFDSFH